MNGVDLSNTIKEHSRQGKALLDEATETKDPKTYHKAIEECVLAVKYSLLKQEKSVQTLCMFNLGAVYVAAGYHQRGLQVLQSLLKSGYENLAIRERLFLHGDVMYNIGLAYEELRNYEDAVAFYENSLSEYRKHTKAKQEISETLVKLAEVHFKRKSTRHAVAFFAEASECFLEMGCPESACACMLRQSDVMLSDRTLYAEDAKKVLESCLVNSLKIEEVTQKCKLLSKLAAKFTILDERDLAECCLRAILRFANGQQLEKEQQQGGALRAMALQNLGALQSRKKQFGAAGESCAQAAALFGKLAMRNSQGQSFCTLAYAQAHCGKFDDAYQSYMFGLQAFQDTDDKSGESQAHDGLAALCIFRKDYKQAVSHYQRAFTLQARCKDMTPESQERLLKRLSEALVKMGAADVGEEADARATTFPPPPPRSQDQGAVMGTHQSHHFDDVMVDRLLAINPLLMSSNNNRSNNNNTNGVNVTATDDARSDPDVARIRRDEESCGDSRRKGSDGSSASDESAGLKVGRRRDHGDDGKRPIQRFARGLSSLTASSRVTGISDDDDTDSISNEGSGTSEDETAIPFDSRSSDEDDNAERQSRHENKRRKNEEKKDKKKKKGFGRRGHVTAAVTPVHVVTAKTAASAPVASEEKTASDAGRIHANSDSDTDYAQEYKAQLKAVDDSDGDLTSVSSSGGESSTVASSAPLPPTVADAAASRNEKTTPPTKPPRSALSRPKSSRGYGTMDSTTSSARQLRFNDDHLEQKMDTGADDEPVYETLAFGADGEESDTEEENEHTYSSPPATSIGYGEATYDEPAAASTSSSSSSDSDVGAIPLSSLYSSIRSPASTADFQPSASGREWGDEQRATTSDEQYEAMKLRTREALSARSGSVDDGDSGITRSGPDAAATNLPSSQPSKPSKSNKHSKMCAVM